MGRQGTSLAWSRARRVRGVSLAPDGEDSRARSTETCTYLPMSLSCCFVGAFRHVVALRVPSGMSYHARRLAPVYPPSRGPCHDRCCVWMSAGHSPNSSTSRRADTQYGFRNCHTEELK